MEFAIFGSIILLALGFFVQYGMRMNYQQFLQMRTFRQAFQRIQETHRYIDSDTEELSVDPYNNMDLLSVDFKPAIDTQDPFGYSSRTPFYSSASVIWSQTLDFESTYGDQNDLPRWDILVAGRRYTFTTAGYGFHYIGECSYQLQEDTDDEDENGRLDRTIISVDCTGNANRPIRRIRTDYSDEYKTDGSRGEDKIYWYMETVDFNVQDPDSLTPIQTNAMYDVDGDGKEEMVLWNFVENQLERNLYGIPLSGTLPFGVGVMDFQEGDINFDTDEGQPRQGLQPDYLQMEHKRMTFNKREDLGRITTTTSFFLDRDGVRDTTREEFYVPIYLNRISDNVWAQLKERDLFYNPNLNTIIPYMPLRDIQRFGYPRDIKERLSPNYNGPIIYAFAGYEKQDAVTWETRPQP